MTMKKLLALLLALALVALNLTALADADATDAQGSAGVADDAAPATAETESTGADTSMAATPLTEADAADATLVEAARAAVDQLCTLCSDESYVALYTAGNNVATHIAEAMAQDYSAPDSITVLSAPLEAVDAIIATVFSAGGATYDVDDAQTCRMLRLKLYNVLPSMLNSSAGAEWLAATSVMTLGDMQVLDGVSPRVAYVIFDYGAERPAAVVAAHVDADGLTSLATTLCMLPDQLRPLLLGGQVEQLLDGMVDDTAQALDGMDGIIAHNVYAPDGQQ